MRSSLGIAALAAALLLPVSPITAPAAAQTPTADQLSGLEFRTIGPAVMSGRIVDLAINALDPTVWYAASATGGVWKTTSNGIEWEPVFEDEGTHSVGAIALHPVDTSVVWVGTGERANRQSSSWGDGVYRSTDGGETWTHVGLEESHHVGRIALHPTDPEIAYVAAMGHLWGPNEERGLYRTRDGGRTWERLLYIDENTGVVDVALDPRDPRVVYAASYQRERRPWGFHGGGPGSAIWKSTDGGRNWTELTNGLPEGDIGRIGLTIYPKDPDILYASVEQGWRFNASTAYLERRAGVYRSDDAGATWRHMSDWNPRPMYASQPLVDPNDDARIYMQNSFSVSADSGKTFRVVRQSLHGDDRFLWIDPRDSRHLIKADDGGIGISWNRGDTWLYVTNLPVSQFYRVAVDDVYPYRVYGGLQDNGTWYAPNETFDWGGVVNSDWKKIGGGDGFLALPDPSDTTAAYIESQYLGLRRYDLVTGESRDIRPGDPRGHIGPRRNFDAWFGRTPEPELFNAMAPANWDGPYIISPHDPDVLYAGTNELWVSRDKGGSWTSLGDMTSGTDRRDLTIMGQTIHDSLPSLDDGIPYWPTITAIAESRHRPGVLYAGTDDGRLMVSRNGGQDWQNVTAAVPGLPEGTWVNGIETSRHVNGRAYAVFNNYRNDDYGNYLYVSEDDGRSWRDITGDLPAERALRTVREDPRNPDVLWLGAEIGVFYSPDRGRHWVELRNGLPTVAVNDLVIQETENDLVLGTHGRGIWIMDGINAIQELSPSVMASAAHLFTLQPAIQKRMASEGGHTGDMFFRGENPRWGAAIDYWLAAERDSGDVAIEIMDEGGRAIAEVTPSLREGVNRVYWDLRHASLSGRPDRRGGGPGGPMVLPGRYTVRLTVDGRSMDRPLEVREDPRLDVTPAQRVAWLREQREVAAVYERGIDLMETLWPTVQAERQERRPEGAPASEAMETWDLLDELVGRISGVYWTVGSWTGPMTADQRSQLTYYDGKLAELRPTVLRLADGS